MLINEKLSFQVARPMVAIQFERGQEGHLSLAARWPRAKPVEEPCSLHPVTGTWTGASEQSPVSFSHTGVHTHRHICTPTLTLYEALPFVSSINPNASIDFTRPEKPTR